MYQPPLWFVWLQWQCRKGNQVFCPQLLFPEAKFNLKCKNMIIHLLLNNWSFPDRRVLTGYLKYLKPKNFSKNARNFKFLLAKIYYTNDSWCNALLVGCTIKLTFMFICPSSAGRNMTCSEPHAARGPRVGHLSVLEDNFSLYLKNIQGFIFYSFFFFFFFFIKICCWTK